MSKIITIKPENYNKIHELCTELGINPSQYDYIKGGLAGKLILDLVKIKMFHLGDLKAGKIPAPAPEDYQEGGKYDCR